MKIITVLGARPQFVKAAVVSRAFLAVGEIEEILVHTGQHFDDNMSEIFFRELGIVAPKFNLGIGGGSHGENTGRSLEAVEQVLMKEEPDYVLVYGDTDSTLAGALAASKLCIPVAHIEAGLRSFNRRMPEEINRIVTDHLADLMFIPSEVAGKNLTREGIDHRKVHLVGDVMFDAVKVFSDIAAKRSQILERHGLRRNEYVLATVHRRENTDDFSRLAAILEGMSKSHKPVILPLHPRTRKRIAEFGLAVHSSIRIIEPVGYLDMLWLENNARMILTDSGGVQKEAYFHGVPCLTLRDETEWVELVDLGFNRLVGANVKKIAAGINEDFFPAHVSNIYGTGHAADSIAKILVGSP